MQAYTEIDLHSTKNYIGIIDHKTEGYFKRDYQILTIHPDFSFLYQRFRQFHFMLRY